MLNADCSGLSFMGVRHRATPSVSTVSNLFSRLFVQVSRFMLATGFLVLVGPAMAAAQTATQTVTFQVDAVNQVGLTGSPTMSITAAVAGNAPTTVTSSGYTWAVTTNQSTAKEHRGRATIGDLGTRRSEEANVRDSLYRIVKRHRS